MRCVKGDMAMIIGMPAHVLTSAPRLAENIGLIVDVLEFAPGETRHFGEPVWSCKARGPSLAVDQFMLDFGLLRYVSMAPGFTCSMPDRFLQPIRPGKEPEKTQTPEDLGAFTI